MVTNITSFGRSGLSDWLMQRVTAVILLAYTLFMLGFFLGNSNLDYLTWVSLFQGTWMRIFSLLALLSLAAHAWIGLWTVSTDYMKATSVRLVFQAVVALALFAYVVWGVQLLWGV